MVNEVVDDATVLTSRNTIKIAINLDWKLLSNSTQRVLESNMARNDYCSKMKMTRK